MEIPFRLVDVFAERALAGNQLCVVAEPPPGLSDELMQAIALEIGFSETTFVTEANGDRYSMRIFTPGAEMPFAGHPTLGTAFVLVAEGLVSSPATQRVAAGEFSVEVDVAAGRARMLQLAPEFGPEVTDLEQVAAAAGLKPADLSSEMPVRVVSTGLPHLIAAAARPEVVADAVPDPRVLDALLDAVDATGLYLFFAEDGEAHARMFAGDIGLLEDPATGSAAGPLGAYLADLGVAGLPGSLRIRQGEEIDRPSVLYVEVRRGGDEWQVWVEGGVAIVGRGVFEV